MKTVIPVLLLVIAAVMKALSADQIGTEYRGDWTCVAHVDEAGKRHPPKKPHHLTLTENRMIRTNAEGNRTALPPAEIFIADTGGMWLIAPDSGERVDLGRASLRQGELHLVGAEGKPHHHLVYKRRERNTTGEP